MENKLQDFINIMAEKENELEVEYNKGCLIIISTFIIFIVCLIWGFIG